jgi:2-dehydropantoate 2-reductase
MRICVHAAGASGGFYAVRLAAAGFTITVNSRGEHLRAPRERGLSLHTSDLVETLAGRASGDPPNLGRKDVVLVATKSAALASVKLEPLLAADTLVGFPQIGMF